MPPKTLTIQLFSLYTKSQNKQLYKSLPNSISKFEVKKCTHNNIKD